MFAAIAVMASKERRAKMPVIISMLRGDNVGGNNQIKMDALRTLYESLGFEDVHTHIARLPALILWLVSRGNESRGSKILVSVPDLGENQGHSRRRVLKKIRANPRESVAMKFSL